MTVKLDAHRGQLAASPTAWSGARTRPVWQYGQTAMMVDTTGSFRLPRRSPPTEVLPAYYTARPGRTTNNFDKRPRARRREKLDRMRCGPRPRVRPERRPWAMVGNPFGVAPGLVTAKRLPTPAQGRRFGAPWGRDHPGRRDSHGRAAPTYTQLTGSCSRRLAHTATSGHSRWSRPASSS